MQRELVGRQNGAAIRAIREKDKRSVADVAAYARIHPQALRNIENGSKPAGDETLRLIAEILDVPVKAITRDGTDSGITEEAPAEPQDEAA
jgi:transcriptional regulator with XRE-family HTH domain